MRTATENKRQGASGPAQLGNVTIKRLSASEWAIERDGECLASGLSFQQALSVIRGELPLDELHNDEQG